MNIKTRNNLTDLIGQLPVDDNNPNVGPSSGNDEPTSNESDLADNQAIDEHGEILDLTYSDRGSDGEDANNNDSNNKDNDDLDYFFG